jgi:hypothetical protein
VKRFLRPSFFPERLRLAESLKRLSAAHCGYTNRPCDCKYGYGENKTSEATGCPEAMAAAAIIESMTDEQYKRLCEGEQESRNPLFCKACPFCSGGSASVAIQLDGRTFAVECPGCKAQGPADCTAQAAAAMWNKLSVRSAKDGG